jgi:hypothetical protein
VIALHWKCPKHPRYNPELNGQGGIRGGCLFCHIVFDEWRRWYQIMREWKERAA